MAEQRDLRERLFAFALRVIALCQQLHARQGVGRWTSFQLFKSATSIGANYEEAQAGQSRADFISRCNISLKEARETCFWLRLLAASNTVPPDQLAGLLDESEQLTKILGAIVSRARDNAP